MKIIYTSLLTLLAGTFVSTAQQLPNNGFEDAWTDCIPWTSKGNTTAQGTTPSPWTISNVIGTGTMGKTTVGEKVQGYNSDSAVKVENKTTVGNGVPGYFSLGTSWATSTGTGSNKDGGTFGGTEFAYRPDAVSFRFQRTLASGSTEQASVVAYMWKGVYQQAEVPGNNVFLGNPSTVTMTDRDRNILGMSTEKGGTVTKSDDAECIATINYGITVGTPDWEYLEIPFTYTSASTPEKMNIIFCAGDYFSTSPVSGNSLTIDDVTMIYYSQLASLSVNGTAIADFASNKYTYTIDSELPSTDEAISYSTLGNSNTATVSVTRDEANAVARITVTNPQGTDINGESTHTYTVQFNKSDVPPTGNTQSYTGTLSIDLMGDVINGGTKTIEIEYSNANTCTVMLMNFALDLGNGQETLGDIIVPNVTVTQESDGWHYSGTVKNLELAGGMIVADATVESTSIIDENGTAVFYITVAWHMGSENDIPISVTFNGKGDKPSGIDNIETDNYSDSPIEYYNLQGIKVAGENLAPGIYIRRQGTETSKILVR